jgi:LmbE family N-acetylglucosaminyl deacetylase
VLCVAPHPDDETIGCGGALAHHAQRGDDVTVLVASSGEGSGGGGDTGVAARREAEVAEACAALGLPASPELLRLPDGTLADHVDPLAVQIARHGAHAATVYAPFLLDPHRDHIAVNMAIAQAGLTAQVFGCEIGCLGPIDALLDVTHVFPRKEQALAGYTTALAQVDYVRTTRGLNTYRSAGAGMGGVGYAEGFVTLPSPRHAELMAKLGNSVG